MKRILINATQAEELRVAMVNGQLLYDLDIEVPSREQKKSNIYKGVITRIEPSLEAAFVNYGAERHGFLPFKEISRDYFTEEAKKEEGKVSIKDAIKVNQEIIVQVEKEERGNKGAALTSFISLAGRFLVAMPQNPRAGGVSRRIEGEDREQVREAMAELEMPKGMGVIARTAGVGRTSEEMQWDLDYLTQLWSAIEGAAKEKSGPFLIYQESDIVIRALRDHYKSDVGEILIDSTKAFERAHEFMSMVMPNAISKLKLYKDKQPLFNRFQIENQIESAFTRTVNLPSGGAIVIDPTEALTSIDVNSARATKGGDIEETAMNTNLEAADEIARQLRIRDLGGLLVIDFIDMMKNKNQREVEQRLRRAVHEDRARVQIGRISRFGLLEMSRQRLRPSLGESSQIVCPRCQGQGTIRDVESLSLAVLRLLEEEALKENTGRILAKLPVECATYLLNEKRDKIAKIEDRCDVHCVIIPDPNLETPHFQIERVRDNDTHRHESSYKSSYELASDDMPLYTPESKAQASAPVQTPAIQQIAPPAPKPASAKPEASKQPGLISKVITALFGNTAEEEAEQEKKAAPKRAARGGARRGSGTGSTRSRGGSSARGKSGSRQQKTTRDADSESKTSSKEQQGSEAKRGAQDAKPSQDKPSRSRGGRGRGRGRGQGSRQKSEGETQASNENKADSSAQSADQSLAKAEGGERKPARKRRRSSSRRDRPEQQSAQGENSRQERGSDADKGQSNTSQSNAGQNNAEQSNGGQKESKPTSSTREQQAPASAATPAKEEQRGQQKRSDESKTERKPEPTVDTATSRPAPVAASPSGGEKPAAAKPDAGQAANKPAKPDAGQTSDKAAKPDTGKAPNNAPKSDAGQASDKASKPEAGQAPAKAAKPDTGSDKRPAADKPVTESKPKPAPKAEPAAAAPQAPRPAEEKPSAPVAKSSSAPAEKPAQQTERPQPAPAAAPKSDTQDKADA